MADLSRVNAWQLGAVFGLAFGTGAYVAMRVVIRYDRLRTYSPSVGRRSVYFAIGIGLVSAGLIYLAAR